MSVQTTSGKNPAEKTGLIAQWRDYVELCKPKVIALMLFTVIVGMLMAAPGAVTLAQMLYALVGIGLVASSAAAINHVADSRIDAAMDRTKLRPLPSGSLDKTQVLLFALVIGALGMILLILKINLLTAVLTFASLVGYAVIYTMYLKRATPQNIVIGGAAGATPPLLGWTAVTGQVEADGLLLFLIIFTWTPPHFWALAIYRKEEYAKVDIPMLPVTHGEDYTRLHITLYTLLMSLITIFPYFTGMSGLVYLSGAILLNAGFLYYAISLQLTKSRKRAMDTFVYSIVYLMALFAVLLFDRYLPMILELS
ncbi:MAG: heme o synthase [Gammaproteobacteria bacterium]|jgi:protoheme IX farnesyltransferase|nr:heme o synthase [Gammaproteobacteria bacterium]|tara:strand:- start:35924 stop:36853 length:930 start_codon:yes stop_codon:yes gene_type:complete